MDAKRIVEELLGAGRDLSVRGRDYAEQKFDLPAEGQERDAMLSNMGKGAAAAGVLALLLGTKTGRKLGGNAVKLGSLAALGGVAYKAYQNYQETNAQVEEVAVVPVNRDSGTNADERGMRLLRAMVAAARADGHIDTAERSRINEQIVRLGLDASAADFIQEELGKPLNPQDMAVGVQSIEEGAEIYLFSLMALDLDNPMEEAYLLQLAKALGLDATLVAEIHQQLDQQQA